MLPKELLTKQKEVLQEEKDQLERQLDAGTGEGQDYLDGSIADSTGELSLYDNHMADSGTELFERSKGLAMEEHHRGQLEKVNKALEAIADGTYGECKECGESIPEERLEAIPYTLYCTEHTPEQGLSNDRPVEEDVLEQTHTTEFKRREHADMADHKDSLQEVAQYGTSETPADVLGDQDNYNDLYSEETTNEGFAEDYESFAATDLDGDERNIVPNKQKEEYEEMLDDSGMESQLGDIPYRERDSYLQDKRDK